MDKYGRFQAVPEAGYAGNMPQADAVCPFSNAGANEDELTAEFLEQCGSKMHPHLGSYLSAYAGRVVEDGYWERGSSGGFTSWLLVNLLRSGKVDAVVHVKPCLPDESGRQLFEYGISTTTQDIQRGAKSHYYPVEMSKVLAEVRATPGRYAFVGVPCFIKALRRLAKQDNVFRERIGFCIGLFCGHLKSAGFAEFLAWQCGVRPKDISNIDFRTKIPDRLSSDYGVTVRGSIDGKKVVKEARRSELIGADWGMGFFKYKACDFCDDISAETADVSVGDAWLPQYVSDSRGTNVVIIRNNEIKALFDEACSSGKLDFASIGPDLVAESQSANVRHRRQDLSYRLYLQDRSGRWRPEKRIAASSQTADPKRKRLQRLRVELRDKIPVLWRHAKECGDLMKFQRKIAPLIRKYESFYSAPKPSLMYKAFDYCRRAVRRAARILKSATARCIG
jgi:coenzyme F420 hydrogenase subunit beta